MDAEILRVPVLNGADAHVDSSDYELISKHKWQLTDGGYARTTIKSKNVFMHRMVLGLTRAEAPHIDHIDGNGLNNRRANLRAADAQKNAWNRRLSVRNKTSQYKAVTLRHSGAWSVRVRTESRCWYGSFKTEELAARAYDVVAVAWFGEFANLNFPGEIEQSRILVREAFKRFRVRNSRLDDAIFADVTSEATR